MKIWLHNPVGPLEKVPHYYTIINTEGPALLYMNACARLRANENARCRNFSILWRAGILYRNNTVWSPPRPGLCYWLYNTILSNNRNMINQ